MKLRLGVTASLFLLSATSAFSQSPLPWQTGNSSQQSQSSSQSAQDPSLHSVSGVPLYIDGAKAKTKPAPLSPGLLDQVRGVSTLADALRILGPAYVAADDNLHIYHWNFQDGQMLTLWPQGGEGLTDTVSVSPRPDCGVSANECKDLVLNCKAGKQQHKHGSGSSSSGGGSGSGGGGGGSPMSFLSPLMKMVGGR
jgi:hypothetical protein